MGVRLPEPFFGSLANVTTIIYLRGSVLGKPPASGYCLPLYTSFEGLPERSYKRPVLGCSQLCSHLTTPSPPLGMRFKLFPRTGKQKTLISRPDTSGDQPPSREYYLGATII